MAKVIKGQLSIFDFIDMTEPEVEPELLPCDNCIFNMNGCEYNTRESYCINGNKQLTSESGWVLLGKGKHFPPYSTTWQDYEVLVYHPKIDAYEYEVWEYKDYTFRSHNKYDAKKGLSSVIAWKREE